jgi:hypothetical protein
LLFFEASLRGCQLCLGLSQRHLQAFENAVVVDCDPAAEEGENDEYSQKQASDHDYLALGNSLLGVTEMRFGSPIARNFNGGTMLFSQQPARRAQRDVVPP